MHGVNYCNVNAGQATQLYGQMEMFQLGKREHIDRLLAQARTLHRSFALFLSSVYPFVFGNIIVDYPHVHIPIIFRPILSILGSPVD